MFKLNLQKLEASPPEVQEPVVESRPERVLPKPPAFLFRKPTVADDIAVEERRRAEKKRLKHG